MKGGETLRVNLLFYHFLKGIIKMNLEELTLKQLRRLKNFTMRDIAKVLEITFQGYHLKESGKRKFKENEIKELAIFFNLDIIAMKKIIKNK